MVVIKVSALDHEHACITFRPKKFFAFKIEGKTLTMLKSLLIFKYFKEVIKNPAKIWGV